jgi:VWFA-related protein
MVLLLDDMALQQTLVPMVKRAARRFVSRLAPGDQMAVIGLSGDGMKSTADPGPLLRSIDRYNVRATGIMRPDDLGAHVLKTFASLARQLAETSARRKTIVAIGPAGLFDTPIPPPIFGRDLNAEWVDAMRAMAFAHASVYVIDPGGVGTSPATGGARGFARETGGHAFANTNDLNAAADQILREAGTYYMIGVTDPPAHRKAPLREVDVRVLRRGITVRARKGIPGTR